MPESFIPPKGTDADVGFTSFTPIMPKFSPSTVRNAVEMSFVYT